MGKRRISDLLAGDSYTGHVAIEWLLDREGPTDHYLCTGFCFTDGYGEQPIRYYNYLFDYDEEAEFTIEKLPLIKRADVFKREYPIQYQELKDWLRDRQEQRIEVFERIKDYHSRLRRYRILPEEWENIRATNASEGGVDEFFAKSRTAEQLVDNLLIPAVEKMMFQEEDKQKKLFEAFSEYRNMLLEIPKIEANIKDFKLISEQAEEVVAEVRNLGELTEDFKESTKDLVRLGKTFAHHVKKAEEELANLHKEQEEWEEKEDKLKWKLASYEAFVDKLNYEKAQQEERSCRDNYKQQEEGVTKKQEKKDKLAAIFYFNQLKERERERDKYKYRLEIINNSAPELKEKLTHLRQRLKAAWQDKREELKKGQHQQKEKITALAKEIKRLEDKLTELEEDREELRNQRANLRAWFNNYKEEKAELMEVLPEREVYNAGESLEGYQDKLTKLTKQIKELNYNLEEFKEQEEGLTEEIIELNKEESTSKSQLEAAQDKLAEFNERKEVVRGMLAREGKYFDSLLEEKEEVLLYTRSQLREMREKRANCQAEIANLEEKWALFADRDYYVPHHELIKVKNFLESKDIYTVLGSEWLAHQQLSPGEKQAYLNHQPLLPYTILIEENQLNKVKRTLQSSQFSQDIPLLFLLKTEKTLAPEKGEEELLALSGEELFLYQPESSQVFVSQTAFNEFKDKLEEKIRAKEDKLAEYKDQEGLLAELKEKTEEFFRRYNLEEITNLQGKIGELKEQITEIKDKIKAVKEEKKELQEEEQRTEDKLAELRDKEQEIERIIDQLSNLVSKEEVKKEKEEERSRLEIKLDQLTAKKKKLANKREGLKDQHRIEKQQLNLYGEELEEHQNEFTTYELGEVKLQETDKSYSQLKNELEQVNDRLNEKQSKRQEIQALVEKCAEQCKELEERIKETEFSREWLEENSREVTKTELKQAKEELVQTEKELARLEEKLNKAKSEIKAARTVWENSQERVKKKFSRSPYLDFSETEHQEEKEHLEEEAEKIAEELAAVENKLKTVHEWKRINKEMLEEVKYELGAEYNSNRGQVERLSAEEWAEYDLEPKAIFRRWKENRDQLQKRLEEQKRRVDSQFKSYLRRLQTTNNPKVKQFTRKVKQIMDNDRLYDYDYVETQFLRIMEGLEQYKKYYQQQLTEREKDREHLTDLCFRRAKTVYNSVLEIPRNSRVELYERRLQIIKLEWEIMEDEAAQEAIYDYLSQVLEDLQQWKEAGRDDDEIDERMEEMLRTRNLINVIAPIEDCRVRVFKPRSESIVRNNQLEYADWSAVSRWSGGEEYSIYITMFMIMTSHIREQVEGRGEVGKTIIADNPFGKASSPHILKTVFEVARANKIQLVCFTAHRQDSILKEFPVVYSLQLRSAYGKEVMQAEEMETGFYNLKQGSESN